MFLATAGGAGLALAWDDDVAYAQLVQCISAAIGRARVTRAAAVGEITWPRWWPICPAPAG